MEETSVTYRGRTLKGEQWGVIAGTISSRVSLEDFTLLIDLLTEANIANRLTLAELSAFEDFIDLYAEAVKR
jgi:hypothetical protein